MVLCHRPELGLEALTTAGSAIRFRALCIHELKKVSTHTFTAADIILSKVNRYLSVMNKWRQYEFKNEILSRMRLNSIKLL